MPEFASRRKTDTERMYSHEVNQRTSSVILQDNRPLASTGRYLHDARPSANLAHQLKSREGDVGQANPEAVLQRMYSEPGEQPAEEPAEPKERKGLKPLVEPRITKLLDGELDLQIRLMQDLNRRIEKALPNEKDRHDVYRVCSVAITTDDDGKPRLNVQRPRVIPDTVGDGEGLEDGLEASIEQHVKATLVATGQLEYLVDSGLLQSHFIEVDVDFYYKRNPDGIGFHKDTIGHSLFVNLNFNNSVPIVGPEYILNPEPIEAHDSHVQDKLPAVFWADVLKAREEIGPPSEISASMIDPYGTIGWVDELMHHSTPSLEHRGITGEQLERALEDSSYGRSLDFHSIRTAYLLKQLAEHSAPGATFDPDYLKKIGLDERQYSFLSDNMNDTQTESLYNLLRDNPEYLEMCSSLERDPAMTRLYELSQQSTNIYRDELVGLAGLTKEDVDYVFDEYEKPDMETVGTAGCTEHECEHDAQIMRHPIQAPDAPRLTRTMSGLLDAGTLPPRPLEKRQFFRTWVQAFPKPVVP